MIYMSQFIDGFDGHLGCKFTQKRLWFYSQKDNMELQFIIWKEIWAYIPSIR